MTNLGYDYLALKTLSSREVIDAYVLGKHARTHAFTPLA